MFPEPWSDLMLILCIISLLIENYDLRRYYGEKYWKICFILNCLVIVLFMVGVIRFLTEI